MIKKALDTEIQFLPGVGPKRASLLARELGVSTIGDLVRIYPFRHIDRSTVTPIAEVVPDAAMVQVKGEVVSVETPPKRLKVTVRDASGEMDLVFFKGLKYTAERLVPGAVFTFFGKPSVFNGRLNMVHPEIDAVQADAAVGKPVILGVYPSTEKLKNAGITGKVMNKLMANALRMVLPEIEETLPDYVLKENGLMGLALALRNVHFPTDAEALRRARYRLKFEELFLLQLSLLKQKFIRSRGENGIKMPRVGEDFNLCYNALPYQLTGAQKRVIKEIRTDMMSGHQMNRLLQGDVGSGKTMVAVLTALLAVGNGYQACIMAPTEVLARQHFANISKYLAPTGVKTAVLTGSTKASERKKLLPALAAGEIGIIVGTHALIEDTVVFKKLGLAIIDEQHRFGVDQRAKLWGKTTDGLPPHVLVMTATPIPRTLAMTLYGDLNAPGTQANPDHAHYGKAAQFPLEVHQGPDRAGPSGFHSISAYFRERKA